MAKTRTRTFNLNNSNDRYDEMSSICSSKISSLEDSYVTIQSCSDDSLMSENQSIGHSHRYIKRSKLHRNDDHVTSLKRRVRKQQLKYDQNLPLNFQLPSSINPFSISYSHQPVTSSLYQTKKSSFVVPLPSLTNNSRIVRTHSRGIQLNTYGYLKKTEFL